jgi:hypothetical protein
VPTPNTEIATESEAIRNNLKVMVSNRAHNHRDFPHTPVQFEIGNARAHLMRVAVQRVHTILAVDHPNQSFLVLMVKPQSGGRQFVKNTLHSMMLIGTPGPVL